VKRRSRGSIILAASGGGHFDMLAAISDAVTGDREWLTVEGPRSRDLKDRGEVVHTVPTFDLDHFNLANPLRCFVLACKLRPRVVVTTGAGVIFTFAAMSWLLGARIVFVETMARVSVPSKTGMALARLAALHIVQWPELNIRFPRAKLCRPALVPDRVEILEGGQGTFVSLGTHTAPFERLAEMVGKAISDGVLPQPCTMQGGTAQQTASVTIVDALPPADFGRRIKESKYVVGHAGAGFISTALAHGRRPIVLPRLSAAGEHVDDHQLQLTRKLAQLDLVVSAEDGISAALLEHATAPLAHADVFEGLPKATDLLRTFLGGL
jgi:UDP-N-acetylglucosamine--N-acetylmuramyl-(pentapeptide) pyrophosphoryl-undecaprenol N-acetylglucosamine transferase